MFIRKNSVAYVKNNVLRFSKFAVSIHSFKQNRVLFSPFPYSWQAWSYAYMEEEKRGGEGLEEKRERERKGKGGKEGDGGCGPQTKSCQCLRNLH